MNPQAGPLVRVLGGVSLVMLCALVGLRWNTTEWQESPPPTFDDFTATVADAAPDPRPAAPTPPAPAVARPSALYSAWPSTACGPSCTREIAAPAEFPWGSGPVATAPVSAPPLDEAPPARCADVAVAFAQAAAWPAQPAAAAQERPWPAPPVLPTRPGATWLEPVVSALFDTDPAQPLQPATAPVQPGPTEPQSDANTPRAVPLDTHATAEPSGPLASSGAPFKRTGQLPADKASGRAPVPLAGSPVNHGDGSPGDSSDGGGQVPAREDLPSSMPGQPDEGPYQGPYQDPYQGPYQGPNQATGPVPTQFPGRPDHFPGDVPNPLPDPAPDWLAPNLPATLPLSHEPGLPERVADERQPGDDSPLAPRFEPVALPADAVGAAPVTEPGVLALLATAVLALAAASRRSGRR